MAKMLKGMMTSAQKEGLTFTQPTPEEQKAAQEDLKNLLNKSRNAEQSKEEVQAKLQVEPVSLKKDGGAKMEHGSRFTNAYLYG
ncbi:hypothetical protein [Nostoc favosum]|uniref:Uncharacterized protein n=1 Tax=Nostoc favosum CHAB5714 TaxID=2780399 RepID=A0ABS8IDV6_9NOSO|nr:hypothetical protein [Nostoc favosum]MCC5602226.1 hypothetical protein [Nostoc favosum CHAB5714]